MLMNATTREARIKYDGASILALRCRCWVFGLHWQASLLMVTGWKKFGIKWKRRSFQQKRFEDGLYVLTPRHIASVGSHLQNTQCCTCNRSEPCRAVKLLLFVLLKKCKRCNLISRLQKRPLQYQRIRNILNNVKFIIYDSSCVAVVTFSAKHLIFSFETHAYVMSKIKVWWKRNVNETTPFAC